MDDPELPASDLHQATDDINRVNRLLQGFKLSHQAIARVIAEREAGSAFTIVDLGCGDGEFLRYLSDKTKGKNLQLIGIDLSERSIEHARKLSVNYHNIKFQQGDITQLTKEDLNCDIIHSMLTFHHLDNHQITTLLQSCGRLASNKIIINDLHRHRLAYLAFRIFGKAIVRHPISYHDGLISVCSGFKKRELESLSVQSGLTDFDIQWHWGFRYLWTINL
jgi:2-polyprenyl-3-methyl-5-hydroxy-6-metoxy-1,4-benzoquinol methylase